MVRGMEIIESDLEKEIYRFVEEVKELLSPSIWQNILLDCSKNEMLILWLLYRKREANMSQIAEYIHVPLNTATGIVARMEKRDLIKRERSEQDKRIVTIQLFDKGMSQMQAMMQEISYYVMQVAASFTPEEMELFFHMLQKIMQVMKNDQKKDRTKSKVKRITIE